MARARGRAATGGRPYPEGTRTGLHRGGLHLRQPAGEKALLGGIGGEGQGAAVGSGGLAGAGEPTPAVGAGGGGEVVAGERTARLQLVEEAQARLLAIGLGDGDGAVELDDGRRLDLEEGAVELCHLAPVG